MVVDDFRNAALGYLAKVTTDADCAQAYTAIASAMQRLAANGEHEEYLMRTMDNVATLFPHHVSNIIDRTIDSHTNPDGSSLFFVLLPVVLSSSYEMPGCLDLSGRDAVLRSMCAKMVEVLGVSAPAPAFEGDIQLGGWIQALPALYSKETLDSTSFYELVNLPQNFRKLLRGEIEQLSFQHASVTPTVGDLHTYYWPIVVFAPAGMSVSAPKPSSVMSDMFGSLISDVVSKYGVTSVTQASKPVLFSKAFAQGQELQLSVEIRQAFNRSLASADVPISAIKVTITHWADEATQSLELEFQTKLMRTVISTLTIPVASVTGDREKTMVSMVLKLMGIDLIDYRTGSHAAEHDVNLLAAADLH